MLEGNQRAKIETTDGVVHIVLFHLTYDDEAVASELDIVLGLGYLLTAHDGSWEPSASPHLRSGVEPILKHGPDHLLWALADDIVDGYFPFADKLGDAIDDVQDAVVRETSKETVEQLFKLKRELILVRRSISPVREVFNQLTSRDVALIDDDELPYFRDIYDHVIRLTDELDNYRELASATLDVYLTTVNNNLSVIMKRLTGVTVILAGIGAVAGIFGMSEAGTALGGGEAGGFWLITAIVVAMRRGRRRDPAQDRLDLGGTRTPPGAASGGPTRGPTPPARGARRRPGACRRCPPAPRRSAARAARGRPSRRRRGGLVAPDLGDLVQEPLVVAGPDLDDHPDHLLAVLDLRLVEERQEHPLPGVGVEVGGAALARLPERVDPHRDVAQRIGRVAGRRDHRQVDAERRDPDPRGDPVRVRGRARARGDRGERRQRDQRLVGGDGRARARRRGGRVRGHRERCS